MIATQAPRIAQTPQTPQTPQARVGGTDFTDFITVMKNGGEDNDNSSNSDDDDKSKITPVTWIVGAIMTFVGIGAFVFGGSYTNYFQGEVGTADELDDKRRAKNYEMFRDYQSGRSHQYNPVLSKVEKSRAKAEAKADPVLSKVEKSRAKAEAKAEALNSLNAALTERQEIRGHRFDIIQAGRNNMDAELKENASSEKQNDDEIRKLEQTLKGLGASKDLKKIKVDEEEELPNTRGFAVGKKYNAMTKYGKKNVTAENVKPYDEVGPLIKNAVRSGTATINYKVSLYDKLKREKRLQGKSKMIQARIERNKRKEERKNLRVCPHLLTS